MFLRLGPIAISGFKGVVLGFEVLSVVLNTCVSAGVSLNSMLKRLRVGAIQGMYHLELSAPTYLGVSTACVVESSTTMARTGWR